VEFFLGGLRGSHKVVEDVGVGKLAEVAGLEFVVVRLEKLLQECTQVSS
jgi:hypothetical protein